MIWTESRDLLEVARMLSAFVVRAEKISATMQAVIERVLPPLSVGGAAPTLVPRALHTPSMVSGRKVADLWPISKGPGFGTGRDSPAYLTGESAAASCLESSFAAS